MLTDRTQSAARCTAGSMAEGAQHSADAAGALRAALRHTGYAAGQLLLAAGAHSARPGEPCGATARGESPTDLDPYFSQRDNGTPGQGDVMCWFTSRAMAYAAIGAQHGIDIGTLCRAYVERVLEAHEPVVSTELAGLGGAAGGPAYQLEDLLDLRLRQLAAERLGREGALSPQAGADYRTGEAGCTGGIGWRDEVCDELGALVNELAMGEPDMDAAPVDGDAMPADESGVAGPIAGRVRLSVAGAASQETAWTQAERAGLGGRTLLDYFRSTGTRGTLGVLGGRHAVEVSEVQDAGVVLNDPFGAILVFDAGEVRRHYALNERDGGDLRHNRERISAAAGYEQGRMERRFSLNEGAREAAQSALSGERGDDRLFGSFGQHCFFSYADLDRASLTGVSVIETG